MEPVTHFMTGACLARAGLNRKAAYATLAMVLAAETPDIDVLWSVDGPIAAFQHHRGITHTLIGLPFEGLVVIAVVWLVHQWRLRRARDNPAAAVMEPGTDERVLRPLTAAPVRWWRLYGFVLIALLSHILLDWTNNYGVRPFFPFDPHWYAGSIVFIFEPVLFLVLLVALVAPALFGLIGSEVGARKSVFRGRGWAVFALFTMVVVWGWREIEHDSAVQLATTAAYGPNATGAEVLRVTASPFPINPYRWHTVADTPNFYQIARVDTLRSTIVTDPEHDLFYKPAETIATQAAKQSRLGRVYLDWSAWPLVTDIGPVTPMDDPPGTPNWTAVRFSDLRFMYDTPMFSGRNLPPLSGTVYVDAQHRVAGMRWGNHDER
jgi:inner membrane protein